MEFTLGQRPCARTGHHGVDLLLEQTIARCRGSRDQRDPDRPEHERLECDHAGRGEEHPDHGREDDERHHARLGERQEMVEPQRGRAEVCRAGHGFRSLPYRKRYGYPPEGGLSVAVPGARGVTTAVPPLGGYVRKCFRRKLRRELPADRWTGQTTREVTAMSKRVAGRWFWPASVLLLSAWIIHSFFLPIAWA